MILPRETITPALKKRIEEAERACREGRCVTCQSKEELNSFLDSLDDDMLSEAEIESIRQGLEDVRTGKLYTMSPSESLDSFIARVDNL